MPAPSVLCFTLAGVVTRARWWLADSPLCRFAPPSPSDCADIVTSTVVGDDVVPRMCTRSFAGLLEELASYDWQAAAAATAEGPDSSSLDVASHLSNLLLWVMGTKNSNGGSSSGGNGGAVTSRTSQGLREAAGAVRAAADAVEDEADSEDGSCGGMFDPHYNAHVPGRVVLFFRQPGTEGGSSASSASDEPAEAGLGMALVDNTSRAVRRFRLSSSMLTDHFIDKGKVIGTLGPPSFPLGSTFSQLSTEQMMQKT